MTEKLNRSEQIAFIEGVTWAYENSYAIEHLDTTEFMEGAKAEAVKLYPHFDPLPPAMKAGQSSGY